MQPKRKCRKRRSFVIYSIRIIARERKAQFFLRHGFSVEKWPNLAAALRQHASENDLTQREPTPLGERFVIDGPLELPDRSISLVRVVWFIETGETLPRLATAYPIRRKKTQ